MVVGALQMPVSDPLTRPPPVLPTAPEAAPGCVGDMAETPRDAGLKQAPAPRNEKAPADFGYVGIDSILEQMRRKAMKQGFEFNIMVVGECAPHAGTPGRGLSVRSSEDRGVLPRAPVCLPGGQQLADQQPHPLPSPGLHPGLPVTGPAPHGQEALLEASWWPQESWMGPRAGHG